ncbi:MAG: hypothetical protein WC627_08380 [Legionella sp.]|jgi:hypothetical protein
MQLDVFLSFDFAKAVTEGTCPQEITLSLCEINEDNAEATVNKLTNLHPSIPIIGLNLYNSCEFQIKCLFEGINNNSNIRHLLITYNRLVVAFPPDDIRAPISSNIIQAIVAELAKSSFLKCVHLTQIPMSDPDAFFAFLHTNKTINYLYIKNLVDAEIIKSAFKAVKKRENTIYLTLHDDNDDPEMELTSEMIHSLAVENGFNNSLYGLNCTGVIIGYEALTELTKVLGRYSRIEELTLEYSQLDCRGMQAIANLLKTNSSPFSLRILDINYNQIGIKGLKLLGDVLQTNTTLRYLNLDATSLLDTAVTTQPDGQIVQVLVENIEDGWNYLLSSLQTNTTLTKIELGGDADGVDAFACWPKIQTILTNNYQRFADSVTELTKEDAYLDTIESVELNRESIGSSWPKIIKLLQSMPVLKKLSLNENDLQNDYTKSVVKNKCAVLSNAK